MPDDTNPGQMPDATQDLQDPTTHQQPTQDVQDTTPDEAFDKDRALNTIRKLRGFEKTAEQLQKRLAEYEAREKEAEMARLSREEQLAAQLKQREAELEFERQSNRDRTNRYEVQSQAARMGIVDPDAAVKLLDWSSLDYDDDGRPQDVENALKALLAEKPYLVRATDAAQRPAHTSPTNPDTRPSPSGQRYYTSAEIADRAIWNANKDDIMRAIREGRIRD